MDRYEQMKLMTWQMAMHAAISKGHNPKAAASVADEVVAVFDQKWGAKLKADR